LTISHPQLGILRNHDLGMSVQKGRTYILKLTTGTVQTVVQQTVMSQWLVFQVTPADAMLTVGGEAWPVNDGSARQFVSFGPYDYRVSSKLYHPEVGRVEVNDPNNKVVVTVDLKPAFGYISVPATGDLSGATIYIDNERVGQTPMKSGALASGAHTVTAVKPLYQSQEQTVTVTDGQTLTVQPTMTANFSTVTLTVDNQAEIWVNGERKGAGSWTGDLASGEYVMETRLENHRPMTATKRITSEQRTQSIHLDAPIPIYGSINVFTTPDMSDVYIDGQLKGQTPLFLQQYLVGNHTVRVSKANYGDYQTSVTIQEGKMAEVSGALNKKTTGSQPTTFGSSNNYIAHATDTTSTQREDALKITVKGVTFIMIPVRGGTFQMGATSEQTNPSDFEKPVHSVTLSDYYIGETEVTQALWQAIMGKNPSIYKGRNIPVAYVSWEDCQKFIKKLNILTGKNFRLPTEAEWEYAARGGSKSNRHQYAGSDDLESVAWYSGSKGYGPQEVKTKSPNELGLYDMSGNVPEWCQDWFGKYNSAAETNPPGPKSSSGNYRVVRGGQKLLPAEYCRVSRRSFDHPSDRDSGNGLRLALSE
jgi:formylglycine-generating enzyme required for sulfatase activity